MQIPTFTIITATYNCKSAFELTANSIRHQEYENIQWIVVDGGSTDGTLESINKSVNLINYYISEPDTGVYNAWNKASRIIAGDWVLFLGAGDEFYDEIVLQRLAEYTSKAKYSDLLYGRVHIKRNDELLQIAGKINTKRWIKGIVSIPCHQGIVHSSALFSGSDTFDEGYKILGDAKFLIEKQLEGSEFIFIDLNISNMEADGLSSNFESTPVILREQNRIKTELNLPITISSILYSSRLWVKYSGFLIFGTNFKLLVNFWRQLTGRKKFY